MLLSSGIHEVKASVDLLDAGRDRDLVKWDDDALEVVDFDFLELGGDEHLGMDTEVGVFLHVAGVERVLQTLDVGLPPYVLACVLAVTGLKS